MSSASPSSTSILPLTQPQHRSIRHLSSSTLLIRNLTSQPRSYQLATTLAPSIPGRSEDDTDLYLRLRTTDGRNARRRANSLFKAGVVDLSANLEEAGHGVAGGTSEGVEGRKKGESWGAVHALAQRRRSASRASSSSVAGSTTSTASSATVRPIKKLQEVEEHENGHLGSEEGLRKDKEVRERGSFTYTSDRQLLREKERRLAMMSKRLLDSFVTLELPPTNSTDQSPSTTSTSSVPFPQSAPTSNPPFFVSPPQYQALHPSFELDFSLPFDGESSGWEGPRGGRVIVKVWTRESATFSGNDERRKGKGKQSARGSGEDEWECMLEWDVDLDGLISLGNDPTTFPPLPPNSLIFTFTSPHPNTSYSSSANSTEYFTAPSPSSSSQEDPSLISLDDYLLFPSDDDELSGGNQSDPGVGESKFIARRGSLKKRRGEFDEQWLKTGKDRIAVKGLAIDHSRDSGRTVRPATVQAILKAVETQKLIWETAGQIELLKKELEGPLDEREGVLALERETFEIQDRIDDLASYAKELKLDLVEARDETKLRREALDSRRARLSSANELLLSNRSELRLGEEEIRTLSKTAEFLVSETHARRKSLITLLSSIFPISSSPDSFLLFTILSLPLPNSDYPPSLSDEVLSSALGYAAQIVNMLAGYLGVPLHYPILDRGSRSEVADLISTMKGPRGFLLWKKGVEGYRFEYGVFLLNKNIEQLMYSQGLTVLDLRNTLPNLQSLILSLSYDPSHSQFSASTLTTPIQFVPPPITPPDDSESTSDDDLSTSDSLDPSPDPHSPFSSDEENEEYSDAEERLQLSNGTNGAIPRSPASTIRAQSTRSVSPAPTLRDGSRNGHGNGNGNGNGVEKRDEGETGPKIKKGGVWKLPVV